MHTILEHVPEHLTLRWRDITLRYVLRNGHLRCEALSRQQRHHPPRIELTIREEGVARADSEALILCVCCIDCRLGGEHLCGGEGLLAILLLAAEFDELRHHLVRAGVAGLKIALRMWISSE